MIGKAVSGGSTAGGGVGGRGLGGSTMGGGMMGGMMGGVTKSERRNQSPGLLPLTPPLNSRYSHGPASIAPPASENTPGSERFWFNTSTTKIPSPGVSAPAPPALRMKVWVAPPAPTIVPPTTNVSERVAAPPSL